MFFQKQRELRIGPSTGCQLIQRGAAVYVWSPKKGYRPTRLDTRGHLLVLWGGKWIRVRRTPPPSTRTAPSAPLASSSSGRDPRYERTPTATTDIKMPGTGQATGTRPRQPLADQGRAATGTTGSKTRARSSPPGERTLPAPPGELDTAPLGQVTSPSTINRGEIQTVSSLPAAGETDRGETKPLLPEIPPLLSTEQKLLTMVSQLLENQAAMKDQHETLKQEMERRHKQLEQENKKLHDTIIQSGDELRLEIQSHKGSSGSGRKNMLPSSNEINGKRDLMGAFINDVETQANRATSKANPGTPGTKQKANHPQGSDKTSTSSSSSSSASAKSKGESVNRTLVSFGTSLLSDRPDNYPQFIRSALFPDDQQHSQTEILASALRQASATQPDSKPYNGSPADFWVWVNHLDAKLSGIFLKPAEVIRVLLSHSEGDIHQKIKRKQQAAGSSPTLALEKIWSGLRRTYGDPQRVLDSLRQLVSNFPKVSGTDGDDARRLEDLSDLCQVLLITMSQVKDLEDLNTSTGLERIRKKLPDEVNKAWRTKGRSYQRRTGQHPSFQYFCGFLEDQAAKFNDLQFAMPGSRTSGNGGRSKTFVTTRSGNKGTSGKAQGNGGASAEKSSHAKQGKSGHQEKAEAGSAAEDRASTKDQEHCLYHDLPGHMTADCKILQLLPKKEKDLWLARAKLCSRCFLPHPTADCTSKVSCLYCKKDHATANHKKFREREQ